ncbi:unnamed protein product [Meganyctiphanes norvegica]|uniref:Transposase n=1 Tax=Meganyctiphanes norvegica TaxID=48144 RepID=A0AAV2Q2P5_MEGNR
MPVLYTEHMEGCHSAKKKSEKKLENFLCIAIENLPDNKKHVQMYFLFILYLINTAMHALNEKKNSIKNSFENLLNPLKLSFFQRIKGSFMSFQRTLATLLNTH